MDQHRFSATWATKTKKKQRLSLVCGTTRAAKTIGAEMKSPTAQMYGSQFS